MHYFLSRNLMLSCLAIEEQVVQIRQLPWVRYLPVVFGRGNVVPLWAQLSILNTQSGFFPHKSVLFQQTLNVLFSLLPFFFSIACFDFFVCLFYFFVGALSSSGHDQNSYLHSVYYFSISIVRKIPILLISKGTSRII